MVSFKFSLLLCSPLPRLGTYPTSPTVLTLDTYR